MCVLVWKGVRRGYGGKIEGGGKGEGLDGEGGVERRVEGLDGGGKGGGRREGRMEECLRREEVFEGMSEV